MAALPLSNNFETGLADETAFTAGNSGNGTAGNAFDDVVPLGASTMNYDTARAAHGTLSMRINHPAAADGAYFYWSPFSAAVSTLYGRIYIYRTAVPTPGQMWLIQPSDGASQMALVRINSSGQIDVFDSTLSTPFNMTNAMPLNEWVRIEWKIVCHATTGIIEAKMFHQDDTSAIETITLSNGNTGTQVDGVAMGQNAAIQIGSSTWLDDILLTTAGYPGPVATGQTLLPDADVAAGGWTTSPLFSKVNDSSDATIITATAS